LGYQPNTEWSPFLPHPVELNVLAYSTRN